MRLFDNGREMPTAKRAARPLALSAFNDMLKNPYYIGIVRYRGVDYDGKHEPLIDKQTFDEVQLQLETNNFAGEKQRVHHHYLKGSILCGKQNSHGEECGYRLIVCNATSRSKQIYLYFVCIGRQRSRTSCNQRALLIEHIETAISDYYLTVELSQDLPLSEGVLRAGNTPAPVGTLSDPCVASFPSPPCCCCSPRLRRLRRSGARRKAS